MKKQMQTISCSKSMVGRVIGKNGETIRALQNFTGAIIQIDQSTDPMKVTVSGTTESVTLAISMVNDIVNGTFKGFAMLRQAYNEQVKSDSKGSQPVYAPGYGLIPPSQQVGFLLFIPSFRVLFLDAAYIYVGNSSFGSDHSGHEYGFPTDVGYLSLICEPSSKACIFAASSPHGSFPIASRKRMTVCVGYEHCIWKIVFGNWVPSNRSYALHRHEQCPSFSHVVP